MFPLLYTGLVAWASDATHHVWIYMRNATKRLEALKTYRSELSRRGFGRGLGLYCKNYGSV
jgi:hypothetical protein